MADIIDAANDRAERDLDLAIKASRSSGRLANIYARLRPCRVCHNCDEPLVDGNALFCPDVAPGENRPACAVDFDKRHGGRT